jgi:hypothetical protein
MLQSSALDWLATNLWFVVLLFGIINLVIVASYVKFYVRIIREGFTYRHYRKGKLLKESREGGIVALIPLLDEIEIDPFDSDTQFG